MMTARIQTLKWTFEKTSRVSKPHLKESNRSIYTETARNPTNPKTVSLQNLCILIYACV
jgi:hypothetical protein